MCVRERDLRERYREIYDREIERFTRERERERSSVIVNGLLLIELICEVLNCFYSLGDSCFVSIR